MNPSGLRPFHWLSLIFFSFVAPLSNGCRMNDPNHNGKMRHSMAMKHARSFLKDDVGVTNERPLDDYDLMVFYRQHYDKQLQETHNLTLYDFLKNDKRAVGPDRFVIAYDKFDRKTYVRDNLRSNEDIESWDEFQRNTQTGPYVRMVK